MPNYYANMWKPPLGHWQRERRIGTAGKLCCGSGLGDCPVPVELNQRLEKLTIQLVNDKSVLLNQILDHFFSITPCPLSNPTIADGGMP